MDSLHILRLIRLNSSTDCASQQRLRCRRGADFLHEAPETVTRCGSALPPVTHSLLSAQGGGSRACVRACRGGTRRTARLELDMMERIQKKERVKKKRKPHKPPKVNRRLERRQQRKCVRGERQDVSVCVCSTRRRGVSPASWMKVTSSRPSASLFGFPCLFIFYWFLI